MASVPSVRQLKFFPLFFFIHFPFENEMKFSISYHFYPSFFSSFLYDRHYHSMEVFATFYIYNSTGHRVAEGHKASFCLEDNQCLDEIKPRYACADFGDQGNFQFSADKMYNSLDTYTNSVFQLN